MICGAPPVGRNQMSQAFKGSPQTGAASKQDISEAENRNSRRKHFWGFIRTVSSRSRRAGRRAFSQEAFRGGACRGRGGSAADRGKQSSPARSGQRRADRLVNLDYFDTVSYANLWEGRCHRLSGLGHAPFWEAPGDFNPLLERFLHDVETGCAVHKHNQVESRTESEQNNENYQESSL